MAGHNIEELRAILQLPPTRTLPAEAGVAAEEHEPPDIAEAMDDLSNAPIT